MAKTPGRLCPHPLSLYYVVMKKLKKWEPLEPGDIVDVVAPGMGWTRDLIPQAKAYLKSIGLQPRIPKNIFGKDLLCANSLGERSQQLKAALIAKDSKAIWCLRGGYGSINALGSMGKISVSRGPVKPLIGLSDITVLHHYFLQNLGWSTIHGPNLKRLALGESSKKEEKELLGLLFGKTKEISCSLKPMNSAALVKKTHRSVLSGGNLATCVSALGTPFALKSSGSFLFFEDVGERGYQVDRMLSQLHWAGALKGVRGVVFGDFTRGLEPGGKPSKVSRVLKAFAQRQRFPVFNGVPCGHGSVQRPIPFGTPCSLMGGPKSKMIIAGGSLS